MNWYYVTANGGQSGPVGDGELDALVASGAVNAGTLVWGEGMPNWLPHRVARPNAVNIEAPPVAGAPGSDQAVCAECGGVFPINDTIRLGSSRVCAKCKPVFVQKMREGMQVTGVGFDATGQRYGGFWIRVAAKILDVIILSIVITLPGFFIFGMIVAATGAKAGKNPGQEFVTTILLFEFIFFAAIIGGEVLYTGFFTGKFGATPGKMACGLRVIKEDGSRVPFGLSFGRAFAEILSRMICYIGYFMIGFDDEKRSLHDRICNTRVIYK